MKTRPYQQRRRADAAADTAARILAAATALFLEGGAEPTLEAVAARAEVSVQTVLRRFGSKDGLFQAAVEDGTRRVSAARGEAPVGDVPGAIANLVAHYVEWGDASLRLLALEATGSPIAAVTRDGRALHHAWVATVFAPQLADRPGRLSVLIALTDVYVWKILHHDLAHPPDEVERILVDLVERALA
jgi:AcrR family transcriptional regulator